MNCIYPNCDEQAVEGPAKSNQWCHKHYGLYPHKCDTNGCTSMVQYDDEPWCFTHSPDSGSSVRGYSYYATQVDKVDGFINSIIRLSREIQPTNNL